jgi:hypothetical protein
MEKETLEEIAKKYYPPYTDGIITDEIRALREGFVKGYEVQAERMYSEEEKELMIKIFHSYWFENNPEHEDNLKEWELSKKLFEQFKKK